MPEDLPDRLIVEPALLDRPKMEGLLERPRVELLLVSLRRNIGVPGEESMSCNTRGDRVDESM